MKKLKIGILVDLLLEGGVQKAAIEQVKELNRLGYQAQLLILMRKKYRTDYSYLLKDIPYQYLSDLFPIPFRKTIKFPFFNFLSTLHLISPILAPAIIKKKDYNLLISWGSTTCLTANILSRVNKIPYVAIIHDPIVYILEKVYSRTILRLCFPLAKPIVEAFEGMFIRGAIKTVLISKVHSDYIKKTYSIDPLVIPLGITVPKRVFKKRGDKILSFGRWQREKNPEFILDLAKEFPHEKFIIAGSWIKMREYLWFKALLKKEKLKKRVKIVSHFNDQQLATFCKSARVWVYPHFETFGLAALEAASYSLPIIMPESSGVTENFKHKVHGFFPSNVGISEYKKYIALLLSNKKLAEQMGSRAREIVKRKYSWNSNVKTLVKNIFV